MQGVHLRKYGVAATIPFELYEVDGVDFRVDAVHTAGDSTRVKDGGAEINTTNAFVDEGKGYSITLTAGEMQAAEIVVYIVDQTATKVWLDKAIIIETYGHAAAMHAMDFNDAVRGGMTALPNAAADGAGGLPISDAGGLDMDAKLDVAASTIHHYIGGHGRPTWHVTKAGNDGNSGKYKDDALLTISAAITAAADGDWILVYGNATAYAEQLDLNAAAKRLTIEGIGLVTVTHGAASTIILYHGSELINLTVNQTGAENLLAIYSYQKNNIKLRGLIVSGKFDGYSATECTNLLVEDCIIDGTYDGLALQDCQNYLIRWCMLRTDCTNRYVAGGYDNRGLLILNTPQQGNGVVENCQIEANRNDAIDDKDTVAAEVNGRVTIKDCLMFAKQDGVGAGDVIGLKSDTGLSQDTLVENSQLITENTGGNVINEYSIFQTGGRTIRTVNCEYDRNTVSGTVTDVNDKTGFSLLSTGLDLVTAWTVDVTGSLSGSVGSVSGAVGSVTAAVTTDGASRTASKATGFAVAGDQMDLVNAPNATAVTAIQSGLSTLTVANVNAEVIDVLRTDTVAELAAVPAASPGLHAMVQFVYMAERNKLTSTATASTVSNDAGAAIGTSVDSDDATTFTRGKLT